MGSSWHGQMFATLQRNLRIKFRDAGHTFQEIVLPIYIITLLVVVKLLEPQLDMPATPLEPKTDAFCVPGDLSSGVAGVCVDLLSRSADETVLAYVPQENAAVNKLVMDVIQQFGLFYEQPALSPKGFSSEDDMLDFYYTHPQMIFAALVFDDTSVFTSQDLPEDLRYTIRINGSYLPSTSKSVGNQEDCELAGYACDANGYLNSGFLALQSVISQVTRATALPGSTCGSQKGKTTFVRQQALPAYHRSFASLEFQLFTALYMVLALSPVLQTTLTHLVQEKQTLLKDCMLLMGLRESVYWLAWLITYALMSAVTSLILVATAKWTTLFEFTSMGMLFLIIYPYTLSLITMAFALSTVFSKAQSATSFSGLLIMCCSFVIIPIDLLQWSTWICAVLSLISPVGLALAVDVIVRAEGRGQGITFYNFWSTAKGTSPLSMGALVCIFFADAILYGIIAWYLDNTWPHPERGPKRHWRFCFRSSYWFPSRGASYMLAPQENTGFVSQFQLDEASFVVGTPSDLAVDVDSRQPVQEDPNMEPVEPELARKAVIICKDLKKAYGRKKRWWQFWDIEGGRGQSSRQQWRPESEVIKGLNINLYEGQLFAFVGHSKSGKSALVSILAGLSQQTAGEAFVYGLPVSDGGTELHSLIGYCPQEDIVLDLLTVREQLKYFAAVKGEALHLGEDAFDQNTQEKKSVAARAEELLEELQLADVADLPAMELSASAKRKLSIAIAMIGDPQVVILDQPTANMDAEAKKILWDLLKKRQKGRVFIFTTESMEEADVVADRKAILSHGVLKCCGSSLFLRNRFGLSYLLHLTKGETFSAGAVLRLLESHIPNVSVVPTSRGQAHATYKLPLGHLAETSALLTELTTKAQDLGVEGGALEATTLEEVFMQFHDEDEEAAGAVTVHDTTPMHTWAAESGDEMEEEALLTSNDSHVGDDTMSKFRKPELRAQAFAMIRSRLALYRRNFVAVLVTFGLPVVITLGVLLAQTIIGQYDTMELALDSSKIGKSIPVLYSVSNETASPGEAEALLDQWGPNKQLYTPAALASRFDVDEISGSDAIGILFDQLDIQNCTVEYTVFYQPSHIHELPAVVAMLDNSLLHTLRLNQSGNGTVQNPASVHVENHPLSPESLRSAADFLVIMLMAVGLLIVPPVLGAQVVVDRQLGLLSLFRVSGMKSFAYWFATVVTDLSLYYISAFLVLVIGMAFGHVPFYKGANLAIFFLFLTTIPALALFSYVLSFFFVTAQGAASLMYIYFVLAALVPYFWVLIVPGNNISFSWHSFLNVVDPPYALISGLHFIVNSIVETKGVNDPVMNSFPRVYTFMWNNYILLSIGGAAVAIVPLLLCIWQLEVHEMEPEAKMMQPPAADPSAEGAEDSFQDVDSINELYREKERVLTNVERWETMGIMGGDSPEGDLILCQNLGKNYDGSPGVCYGIGAAPGFWALRDLWLAVGRGQTVALVGGQKSGKSTLIHALAGTIPISFGDALINGESVRHAYRHKQRLIGLCPQFEAVYYSMTVREHLELFAILKGVPEPRSMAVEATLQALQLTDAANEIVGKCSVGVRRKLSIGIGIIGGSSVLLLDEPTAGADIATKRRVWKNLAAQSGQRAALICTQSFEEAEALGQRVGILINGQLKCIASPQELKLRYGSSYSLSVMASAEKMPTIREFITSLYPSPENVDLEATSSSSVAENGVELVEGVGIGDHWRFRVPVQDLFGLVRLLQELELKREELGIRDYVVSQPTLRQVFHRLTLGDPSL
ncbi:hypothetical protein R1sor_009352 [Riccia sorocarpa]|uniref:ABC transporter domain-containing protein n=1 Tax=Riccia sorocarpa TaxID=122646 RepID=A0ABD3HYZ0_9MARC